MRTFRNRRCIAHAAASDVRLVGQNRPARCRRTGGRYLGRRHRRVSVLRHAGDCTPSRHRRHRHKFHPENPVGVFFARCRDTFGSAQRTVPPFSLQPLRHFRLNNRPVRQQNDKEHLAQRSFDRVREANMPERNRRCSKLLRLAESWTA
jgi:hypothetical protein